MTTNLFSDAAPKKRDLRVRATRGLSDDALIEKTLATDPMPSATTFLRPVGVSFIAQILGKSVAQTARRLKMCPIVGHHKVKGADQPLYDFITTMSYLVPPKGNIEDWFANNNAATLPPYVNKMFWDSAHQRNRVLRDSNDLWHTDDVLTTLGRVALIIKEESNLWIDNLPGSDALTNAQSEALRKEVHKMQDMIRERMIDLPEHFKTHAMSQTIASELQDSGTMPDET